MDACIEFKQREMAFRPLRPLPVKCKCKSPNGPKVTTEITGGGGGGVMM